MIESILLVTSLCIDAFVTSFGYGVNKVKVPLYSNMIISVVSSAILAISLFAGTIARDFLPQNITMLICFLILFLLGSSRLVESFFKSYFKKKSIHSKDYNFNMLDLKLNFNVSVEPDTLDTNKSKILKPAEAFTLALALSLDGLAIGFGSGLVGVNYIQVILFSLISNILAVSFGCLLGNVFVKNINLNLSWLSGLILLIIGFMKIC
ncbi:MULTISPECIES: sporulation membrane protein YtaF [unclassified Clostridioides]|uniref:sporulation membrane protein YtaF n=1 Tax=unclassified Clostridioides TaxID=2635829 RepID=UPI001D0C6E3D|nr:sporulation membrane protein YtaF [Clostridioides sp. ES-S-0001-03]MCC0702097.1 sporulation membrane protein YtaF [Clostridioides sp. ES-S-0049-02]UDN60454.1 sporulation membrane protein YtaF [Clostridioides sp. ES-W-0016-02]